MNGVNPYGLIGIIMVRRRKVIGVVPLVDEERNSYWMLPGYMKCLEAAGALPVVLPLTDDEDMLCQLVDMMDGFLFTGGHDVSPMVYGEDRIGECGKSCDERDRMEELLFRLALDKDKPILGICRGFQFINAVLGGTLYQDLPSQHQSDVCHQMTAPYDRIVHTVRVVEGSGLHLLYGKNEIGVNSYHHQAIKKLSPRLEAMAYAPDGLVEAVSMPGVRFVWAVQWHPEFAYNGSDKQMHEDAMKLIRRFVEA